MDSSDPLPCGDVKRQVGAREGADLQSTYIRIKFATTLNLAHFTDLTVTFYLCSERYGKSNNLENKFLLKINLKHFGRKNC